MSIQSARPGKLLSRLLATLWLLGLMAYVFAGMSIAPFHGDEAMHIYSSRDFAAVFLRGDMAFVTAGPPYIHVTDARLRLMNGSVGRHAIGLAWWLAGLRESDLPTGEWSWPEDMDANRAQGHLPSDQLLMVSRIPSTLALALSVVVMFALVRRFTGPIGAFVASALYALHPAILLNGRRAMQEGPLLYFGLLVIVIAAEIARRIERHQPVNWRWWIGLSLAGGLALASKHSAIVFVVGSLVWLLAGAVLASARRGESHAHPERPVTPPFWITLAKVAGCSVAMLALFVALSPALWNGPLDRLQDLLAVRGDLLEGQVSANSSEVMPLSQRLAALAVQPFIAEPQYYEAAFWADFPSIRGQVARYDASWLGGLRYDLPIGLVFSVFAAIGLAALLVKRAPTVPPSHTIGLVIWLVVTSASLLLNPLPWQRYFLPLMPIAILLTTTGLISAARWRPPRDMRGDVMPPDSSASATVS